MIIDDDQLKYKFKLLEQQFSQKSQRLVQLNEEKKLLENDILILRGRHEELKMLLVKEMPAEPIQKIRGEKLA